MLRLCTFTGKVTESLSRNAWEDSTLGTRSSSFSWTAWREGLLAGPSKVRSLVFLSLSSFTPPQTSRLGVVARRVLTLARASSPPPLLVSLCLSMSLSLFV